MKTLPAAPAATPITGILLTLHFKTILILLFLALAGLETLHGQTLTVSNEGGSNQAHFNISGLPELAVPPGSSAEPFYWIFTMYENGEYSPVMYRTWGENGPHKFCWQNYPHETSGPWVTPAGSPTVFDYIFPAGNAAIDMTYSPVSYIIARKGDPPPPPPPPPEEPEEPTSSMVLNAESDVSITHFDAEGSRATTIPDGDAIHLAHSQGFLHNRNEHNQSVFIVSYKPCLSAGGRVHLFYGRKSNGAPGNIQDYVNSNHLDPLNIHFPSYPQVVAGISHFQGQGGPEVLFADQEVFEFTPSYVTSVRSAIGEDAEFRVFSSVSLLTHSPGTDNDLGPNDWSYALAVLTTRSNSCPCPCVSCLTNPSVIPRDLLRGLQGYDSVSCTLYEQNIVGFDTIHLKSGEPTDPNRIVINRVCQDGTVFLNLKFCNLPNADVAAAGATVAFRVIDDNFEWCGIEGNTINYPEDNEMQMMTRTWYLRPDTRPGTARYFCQTDSISVNELLPRGECASVNIVLKLREDSEIDINDLLEYLERHEILEASIQFTGSEVLRVRNDLLIKYSLALEPPCVPPCETCASGGGGVLGPAVLAAAVVGAGALLLFWFRFRRRNKAN